MVELWKQTLEFDIRTIKKELRCSQLLLVNYSILINVFLFIDPSEWRIVMM